MQSHPDFDAAYSGQNSFLTHEDAKTSVTSTIFLGARLWNGGEVYASPELSGGDGLSGATGIAGFVNGETFRIGDPRPSVTVARIFIKQTWNLSEEYSDVSDDALQLPGRQYASHIMLAVGKISMTDFFDVNRFSHDPRTQFLNWALMANGAWDYPANTRGYTWGLVAEAACFSWTVRISSAMVPTEANRSAFDDDLAHAKSETIELELPYTFAGQKGTARVLGYYTQARMGNYREAIDAPISGTPDVVSTRAYGRTKYGFGINIEQPLAGWLGLMIRGSWNDGKNETWMFTEIDRAASSALAFDGDAWGRAGDHAGIALVVSGLSTDHRDYLDAGGYGFLIGDGRLHYAPETIVEAFYLVKVVETIALSGDYQFVLNPAYNIDRGPVHVFALRAHTEF